jgi:hypothetical protein
VKTVRLRYKEGGRQRDTGIWLIALLLGSRNGGIESEITVAGEGGGSGGESTSSTQPPVLGELTEERVRDKAA